MLDAQAEVARRKRDAATQGQGDLFGPIDVTPRHYETLRARYTGAAQEAVKILLAKKGTLSYDDAWRAALTFPLVWESDLKDWIATWMRSGSVTLKGLGPKDRVPKLNKQHTLTACSSPVHDASGVRKDQSAHTKE